MDFAAELLATYDRALAFGRFIPYIVAGVPIAVTGWAIYEAWLRAYFNGERE
jgi:hypothetical protein